MFLSGYAATNLFRRQSIGTGGAALGASCPSESTACSISCIAIAEIEKICEAKDILLQRLDRPPSLIELARQVGMNDCTLKRGFRQVFGMTAMSCLHHYRMELAQQLLTIGEMNVNQVATAIGYASRSSFYTAFRKQFGVSPHQYLTQNRKNSVGRTNNSVSRTFALPKLR
ncbi:helix-turn-helix transcriptional regulator [Candidatus Gracilibacteria bacterium]|nr:helix-turn-helix transcriptional regulator [Candidatus Gracilibacteria bacterium]